MPEEITHKGTLSHKVLNEELEQLNTQQRSMSRAGVMRLCGHSTVQVHQHEFTVVNRHISFYCSSCHILRINLNMFIT